MRLTFALPFLCVSVQCFAGVNLTADEAPVDPPWEYPATISYVSNGDGTSNATIDAVLKYTNSSTPAAQDKGVMQTRYGLGAYIHKDTTSNSPRNDRGLSFSYGGTSVPDTNNNGAVYSLGWAGKVSIGKSLAEVTNAGITTRTDATKDRETLYFAGYYQLPISGTPISNPRPLITFFDGKTGLYSDNNSSSHLNGRLSGIAANIAVNFAPLGIDPDTNKLGNLGMIPTFRFSAQVQHDLAESGTRLKSTYKLYTATCSLSFAKLDKKNGGIIPSLNLTRTVGADLLASSPYHTKTELSLGLTF